ncbi:MAG: serine/threonine protein kinase, partial [Proteobacteria bacterium]
MARELVAGKYKLIRLLGRGGMGEVHEATHLSTGRRVAVKLLTFVQTTGDDDPNRLKEVTTRFYREA